MKKRLVGFCILVLTLFVALAGCGGTQTKQTSGSISNSKASTDSKSSGTSNPLIIKVATGTAPEHPENLGANKFKEILEKESKGAIKVQVFPNGQLGSQDKFVDDLRNGTLQVTMVTPGFFAKYAPVLNTVELPYLIDNPKQALKVIKSPVADTIRKLAEANGVHVLAFWDAGLRETTNSKRPIVTPDDLKGLKIRVPQSKVNLDTWKAFGANPSPLAFTEVYMALKQGVFDGQENPPANIYNSKLYEAQKYLSMTNHLQMIHMFMYSGTLWKQLTPDQQKMITDAAEKAGQYQWDVTQKQDSELISKLKEKGMQVNDNVDIKAFKAKVQPLYDQYIKEYGDQAKQIIDGIKAAGE